MYRNYGDRNFFEHGILADSDHSDTVIDLLLCEPYSDEEDLYCFARVQVDLEDAWIDWDMIQSITGYDHSDQANTDPVDAAIAAVSCYSWDNFGAADYGVSYDWQRMTRNGICKELRDYQIAWDEVRAEEE